MLPLLRRLSDGREHPVSELYEELADEFGITSEERARTLPSGPQPLYVNRIAWARSHLGKAGTLQATQRGVLKITERGRQLLATVPQSISMKTLAQYAEYQSFREQRPPELKSAAAELPQPEAKLVTAPEVSEETPQEIIPRLINELNAALRLDLLSRIKAAPPKFFEDLVVHLMLKMGYGGYQKDAGQMVGKSGDGGIDGIIDQDRLGLDTVYLQAKRWEGVVGRPDVQAFVGSLAGHRAKRGVFITTSSYSKQAREYVTSIEARVILLDGEQLAALMIEHDLGVSPISTYVVKRVDGDYFEW